jgi:hypothetical protein
MSESHVETPCSFSRSRNSHINQNNQRKNDLDPLFYISLLDSELRSVGNDNRSLIRYLLIWSYHISHGDNKTQVLIYLRSKSNFLKQININRFVL